MIQFDKGWVTKENVIISAVSFGQRIRTKFGILREFVYIRQIERRVYSYLIATKTTKDMIRRWRTRSKMMLCQGSSESCEWWIAGAANLNMLNSVLGFFVTFLFFEKNVECSWFAFSRSLYLRQTRNETHTYDAILTNFLSNIFWLLTEINTQ